MIRIVTDSTGYLPSDIIDTYGISVVPLKVQFGSETYDEITGISNHDFYQRLTTTRDFPTTSQPSAGEFKEAYQKILAQHPDAEVLVLTISHKLSGTYNSARSAAEQLPAAKITVFDSRSAAMGLGLMVMTAAKMAVEDQPLAVIKSRLEQMRRETSIVLVVDSLEYLKRGGRIGAAAAFLGTLLNTKPILAVVDGEVQPLDRVRTKKKAMNRLFAELDQKLSYPEQPIQAGVMHVATEPEAQELAEMIQRRFNITYFFISELGPVVGAHVGPGTLGVGLCPEAHE
jgi:DegV family protein with EDD domain